MRISDKWQNFHYLAIIVIALSSALIVQESYGSDSSKWEARREAKILRVALPSLPTSLDAIKLAFAEHFLVVECLCEALVRVDESGQITSGAAERWEYSENGRDVHFHFAKNKKFSELKLYKVGSQQTSLTRWSMEESKNFSMKFASWINLL